MKTVEKAAQAGTLESGDILVVVAPATAEQDGIVIELQSLVMAQYGDAIRATIAATLQAQGVTQAAVQATDRGALDCTIRARVLTALARGGVALEEGAITWSA